MSRPKGSTLTIKHKEHISEARKGQQNTLGKHWNRSDIPWNKGLKGIHLSPKTEFQKGMIPWNKGKKGNLSLAERKKKSEKMKTMLAEKSLNWKGGNYQWLHRSWIRRQKGKPTKCELCRSENNIEWANKTHQYKRDISDWIMLCKSCHHKWDKIWLKRKRGNDGRFL